MNPSRQVGLRPFWAIILLPLTALSMALLVFEHTQVPVETQNAYLVLIEVPFAIVMGALVGFILQRPGAGGWTFTAVVLGALLGNLAYFYFVESREVPMGPYEWNYAGLTSLLGSVVLGTPAGASGYVAGLVRLRRVPSNEFAVLAFVLGIMPTLFGIAMLPVAIYDWATGYAVTLVLALVILGSGLAVILGELRIRQLRVLSRSALGRTETEQSGRS